MPSIPLRAGPGAEARWFEFYKSVEARILFTRFFQDTAQFIDATLWEQMYH
jgi:hypothetical protein